MRKIYSQNPYFSEEAQIILQNKDNIRKARSAMIFMQTYFPNHFPTKEPRAHIEWLTLAMCSEHNTVIAAPRSHSKSTLLSFGLALYYIVHMDYKYIVIASESLDKARMFVTRLRDELTYNHALIRDYCPEGFKTTDWAKSDFITTTRVKVEAIGYGQSGRGLIFDNTRPDLVIYDDLETTENAGDQTMKDKFDSDLYPAIARANPNHRRIYVGTIIRKGALLEDTLNDSRWVAARYEATDEERPEDKDMLAPQLYSAGDYNKDKDAAKQKGKLSIFMAENHNNPNIQDATKIFKEEYFRYYTTLPQQLKYYIAYDPALPPSGRSKKVDRTAIIVLATSHKKEWYVVHIEANRDAPSDNRKKLIQLMKQYKPSITWMETIAAQRGMYLEMINDMKKQDIRYPFREIPSHSSSKEARIEQLQPMYEQGRIWHNKDDKNTALLEEELQLFGNTPHDDISDALSFFINRVQYTKIGYNTEEKRFKDYGNYYKTTTASWKVL